MEMFGLQCNYANVVLQVSISCKL